MDNLQHRTNFLSKVQNKYMEQPIWNFEEYPAPEPEDETSRNLRAYFDRMPDDKMQEYSKDWTDEQVIEWDGNFTDEGNLLLICVMRDVDIDEYRQMLEASIEYRNIVRPTLTQAASE